MKKLLFWYYCFGLLFVCFPLQAQERNFHAGDIVLVAGNESDVLKVDPRPFNSLEIRKLFLGVPISRDNTQFEGVVYEPNDEMRKIFLKAIVGMSPRTYSRKVIQARLSSGGVFVQIHTDINTLVAALNKSSAALSFVTFEEAIDNNLHVVQVLWQDRN